MTLLLESGRAELWRGDILRLPEGHRFGPDGGSVDVMVLTVYTSASCLGLVWVSGYDAGDIWFNFPGGAAREGASCIDMQWLKSNWSQWFAYQWKGKMRVIDIAGVKILKWNQRTIVETT